MHSRSWSTDWSDWFLFSTQNQFTIFASPVVDTSMLNCSIKSILSEFQNELTGYIKISFRSSNSLFDKNDINISWTGFSFEKDIPNNKEISIKELGLYVVGQYIQIRFLLYPSSSASINDMLPSPYLVSFEIKFSNDIDLLANLSDRASNIGTIIGQLVNFSGSKKINKISLDLNIENLKKQYYITGKNNNIGIQAINFQSSRNDWVFQPEFHWIGGWKTSGLSISNRFQELNYSDLDDIINNAPYLEYQIVFPSEGIYDLWGYGYTLSDTSLFLSINKDISNLRNFSLGSNLSGFQGIPMWTKVANIYIKEGGLNYIRVYLGELTTVVLDEWLFTKNTNLELEFNNIGDNSRFNPLPISSCPFVTGLRLRSLHNKTIDDLDNPYIGSLSITSWLNSQNMYDSGKFNYNIKNSLYSEGLVLTGGLSLEFFQIGGSNNDFSSWNFVLNSNLGDTFLSIDFGQTYE